MELTFKPNNSAWWHIVLLAVGIVVFTAVIGYVMIGLGWADNITKGLTNFASNPDVSDFIQKYFLHMLIAMIALMFFTLYMQSRSAKNKIKKQNLEVGDEVVYGQARFIVEEVDDSNNVKISRVIPKNEVRKVSK